MDWQVMTQQEIDEYWMGSALEEAAKAGDLGEVPIGAVLVIENQLVAKAHNLREIAHSATAHAEILAIQAANHTLKRWRLEGATLYVTVEPCPMCAGALIMSRVDRVVFGTVDNKAGCAGSLMNLLEDSRFNHQPQVVAGVRQEECSQIMKDFFKSLRQRNKARKLAEQAEED